MDKDIFEIDLDDINVEDIMKQIREKIRKQGIVDEEINLNNTNYDLNVQECIKKDTPLDILVC